MASYAFLFFAKKGGAKIKYAIRSDATFNWVTRVAGIGVVLYDENEKIVDYISHCEIPHGANRIKNITAAEAKAVFLGLKLAEKYAAKEDEVEVYIDNEAVVKILNGAPVPDSIKRVIRQLQVQLAKCSHFNVSFLKEKRENNRIADALAFAAIRASAREAN